MDYTLHPDGGGRYLDSGTWHMRWRSKAHLMSDLAMSLYRGVALPFVKL